MYILIKGSLTWLGQTFEFVYVIRLNNLTRIGCNIEKLLLSVVHQLKRNKHFYLLYEFQTGYMSHLFLLSSVTSYTSSTLYLIPLSIFVIYNFVQNIYFKF